MWDKSNCSVICTLFKSPSLRSGLNVKNIHSPGHSPVSQIATHIRCIMSSTAWNSSTGTSWIPVALRLAVWRITRATYERSGRGSCSQYSCSIPFPSSSCYRDTSHHNTISTCLWFVQLQSNFRRHGWNFRVIGLTIRMSCLEFPFEFAASNSTQMPSNCCCLSTLSFLCASSFSSWYRFLYLSFASLFSLIP